MRENFKGETKKIISLYKQLIKDVEEEISDARAKGLKDTDDYIQTLQDSWMSYRDALKEIEEEVNDNVKDATDELIDIRLDMIKQEIDDEKDALDKRLDNLKDFYDKQKDLLKKANDEEEYLKDQAEKRKAVLDIQTQLDQLQYDNSAWAQKRRLELEQDLADAQEDLSDFEKDHALQNAEETLDKLLEIQEKEINAQSEALDKKEQNAKEMYEQALADIRNGSVSLYEEMIKWNDTYGDGITETIKTAWEEAYVALEEYKELHDSLYKDINLKNATGWAAPSESWDNAPVSGVNKKSSTTVTPSSSVEEVLYPYGKISDSTKTLKKGSSGNDVKALQYALTQLGFGNSHITMKGDFGDYTLKALKAFQKANGLKQSGTLDSATKSKLKELGYATGTPRATAGLHAIDELGTETIFESSDGTKYRMFTGGEKVLNAKASKFLYDFANNGGTVFNAMQKMLNMAGFKKFSPVPNNTEIRTGDIIIQGNANEKTVSEIRRAQRDEVSFILKEFSRLQK